MKSWINAPLPPTFPAARSFAEPGSRLTLPWLESIPLWGATPNGKAPQVGPKRFAALFMGTGINPPNWWAKGSGAEMELGACLEPLAPLRAKLNVIDGLFNKAATGVGIHPGQTGNLLSGAPLVKGAELKLCSLYLSLMDRLDVKLDRFGDADTRLAGI